MNATVVKSVNSRFEPNTGARKAAPKLEGTKVEIVGLTSGETYRGSDLWFIDDQGMHYTSHAISIGIIKNRLSGIVDFAALWSKLGTTSIKVGIYDTGVSKNDKLFGNRVKQINPHLAEVKDHHADYMAAIIAGGDFINGYFGMLPTASIYSYQSVRRGDSTIVTPGDLTIALRAFMDENVDVINISMRSDEMNDMFRDDQELQGLLTECRDKGIAVAACTGNNGGKTDNTKYYPARYEKLYSIAGCNLIGISSPDLYSDTNLWSGVSLLAPVDQFFTNDFFETIGTDDTTGTSVSTAITSSVFGMIGIRNKAVSPGNSNVKAIDEYIKNLTDFPKDPVYANIQASSFKLMNLANLKFL